MPSRRCFIFALAAFAFACTSKHLFVSASDDEMTYLAPDNKISLILNGQNVTYNISEFAMLLTKFTTVDPASNEEISQAGLALSDDVARINLNIDIAWLLLGSYMVFLMQAGFTFLELGCVSLKNTKHIIVKNLGDCCIGVLVWWAWGFAFAFSPGNPFIGDTWFFLSNTFESTEDYPSPSYNGKNYAFWLFQWAFALKAASIVSGAVAERVNTTGYFIGTFFNVSLIYPVVAHWAWSSTGWASAFKSEDKLFGVGVIDFAGSAVIHTCGGTSALMAAIFLGPRKGRFDVHGQPVDLPQQSIPFQSLGTLMLWFGWYGFNAASTLGLSGNLADVAAKTAVNTTIGAAAGGLACVILGRVVGVRGQKIVNPVFYNNGILAGLVAITAGCSTVQPYAAVIIGAIAAVCYFFAGKLLLRLKIDDVVEAVPVHLAAGMWGVVATGLFATSENYVIAYNDTGSCGAFYGCGLGGKQLAAQVVFILAVVGWSSVLAGTLYFTLRKVGLLRVTEDVEELGMDQSSHGGHAYEISSINSMFTPEKPAATGKVDYKEMADTPTRSADAAV